MRRRKCLRQGIETAVGSICHSVGMEGTVVHAMRLRLPHSWVVQMGRTREMGHHLWKRVLCGKRSPVGDVIGFALRMIMVLRGCGGGGGGMGTVGLHVCVRIGWMGVGILGARVVLP